MEGEGGKQIYQTGIFMENCWSIGTQCNFGREQGNKDPPWETFCVVSGQLGSHLYRVASREKGRVEP